jgi:hypothetical protein
MPKNKVSDLVTDQEMLFARLILSGSMTDQQAAEAAGLNPSTAAYTKSKPRVRAYMLEYRALMQQQLAEQEAEGLRRFHVGREQVLDRLWELASLGPDITRGSITGQVKAMSMIVAIEGLIPDRRAGSAGKNPEPPPTKAYIHPLDGRRNQEDQEEDRPGLRQAGPAPASAAEAPQNSAPAHDPILDPTESTIASESQWPPHAAFAPGTRVPFSIPKNFFARRR